MWEYVKPVEIFGKMWKYEERCGNLWASLKIFGNLWKDVETCGNPLETAEICGNMWQYVEDVEMCGSM